MLLHARQAQQAALGQPRLEPQQLVFEQGQGFRQLDQYLAGRGGCLQTVDEVNGLAGQPVALQVLSGRFEGQPGIGPALRGMGMQRDREGTEGIVDHQRCELDLSAFCKIGQQIVIGRIPGAQAFAALQWQAAQFEGSEWAVPQGFSLMHGVTLRLPDHGGGAAYPGPEETSSTSNPYP